MMTSKKDRNGVEMQKNGYVWKARCPLNHGGNRGLAPSVGEHYECQGCGASYHASGVIAMQAERLPPEAR